MKKYLLFSFLFLSFVTSFSQEKKLLQNYTYRIDRFRALDFRIDANAQKQNDYNVSNNYNGSFGGAFSSFFYTLKSNDNLLQTISTGLSANGSSSKSASATTNKIKSLNILPFIYINNKWFSKNYFLEFGTNFSDAYATSHTNENSGTILNRLNNSNFAGGNVTLGIGKGRLENITDMQNAVWLHNILLKENNLKGKLSEEEIIGLAKTITTSNNKRVLDGRKRIQFILKNVDDYLQRNDAINKTDINYFSNLNDVIFFANNATRQAGTEKYIRLIPSLVHYFANEENSITAPIKASQNENGAELVLKIGIQKYKPLSLTHQIDYGLAAKANYGKSTNAFKNYVNSNLNYAFEYNDEWKKVGLDYFLRYSIYPNTRTVVDFDLKGENGYQSINGLKELYHTVILAANASYFISYNTRLNINLGTTYNKNNVDIRAINRYNPSNLDKHNLAIFFNTSLNIAL
jgi:hypothetical protein